MCQHQGDCISSESSIPPYDLSKLIPSAEDKLNLFSGLKQFLHKYEDFRALLCLCVLGIKFLADIICISMAAIRTSPGAALAMFSQLYLFNRATYLKIMQRYHNLHRPTGPATSPIELTPLNPPGYPCLPISSVYPPMTHNFQPPTLPHLTR